MNPVKGNLSAILCVLMSLLVSEISCEAPKKEVQSSLENEAAFLRVRLALMKNHYKFLCHQFSSLAQNCSAPEVVEKEGRRLGGHYIFYWIGLSDATNEGDRRWMYNSTLTTLFWNVHKSEPDNHTSGGPDGEDCAVVDSRSQIWYNVPCGFLYPLICQKAADPLI